MRNTIEAARNCGMLKDAGAFLDEDAFGYLPNNKIMLLCTGSQGEPRAAMARIAEDNHPNITLEEGDLVIFSARTIPGNEKEVGAIINNLAKLRVDVITSDDALVHSSGHPRQGELKQMYDWIKPRALIPMHGEPRHMYFQEKFARAHGIKESLQMEDGKIARLCPGPVEIIDQVTAGVMHVDGKLIVDGLDGPAKQRRKLSQVGIIFAQVLVDEKLQLAEDIDVMLDGVPLGLEDEIGLAAEKGFDAMPKNRRKEDAVVEEVVRTSIRRAADMAWGKKPVVKVMVVRV